MKAKINKWVDGAIDPKVDFTMAFGYKDTDGLFVHAFYG